MGFCDEVTGHGDWETAFGMVRGVGGVAGEGGGDGGENEGVGGGGSGVGRAGRIVSGGVGMGGYPRGKSGVGFVESDGIAYSFFFVLL